VLSALLRDGLRRASDCPKPKIAEALRRLRLVEADARDHLASLRPSERPDVVYLDPMYPPRTKSALPAKELQVCRLLVGDDGDADDLFAAAMRVASQRVVVKRPIHAPLLGGQPTGQIKGKSVRFDFYCVDKT
jgi:16S rRNA (guanine1516-N2)-methyltransferase